MQFLTDKEYEAVRRDVATILGGLELSNHPYYGVEIENRDELISKITAYVDQKIKHYY